MNLGIPEKSDNKLTTCCRSPQAVTHTGSEILRLFKGVLLRCKAVGRLPNDRPRGSVGVVGGPQLGATDLIHDAGP